MAPFLYEDHVRRFVVGVDGAQPLWWYVPVLGLGILPYAGWLPFAAAAWFSEQGRRLGRPATFAACWFSLWFVLISASAGKQEQYIVPLLPPLAMLMAAGMLRVTGRRPGWWARAGIAAVPATVAVLSAIFLGYLARKALLTVWPATAFGLLALVGIAGVWAAFRWPTDRAIRGAVACGVLTSVAGITAALPPLERTRAAAPMAAAQAIRDVVGQARVVSYGGPYTPTPRVTFYLNAPRPLRRLETPDELEEFLRLDRTSYLLLPQPAWEALEHAHRLRRPVAAKASTGRADYILLAPPGPAGMQER
jgi:4-amino-4-deoxy-L-arabinose transferase-like glycosyltransferase